MERQVGAWLELPLWLPEGANGFFAARNDKAVAAGLTFRPLLETVRDTLAWARETSFESSYETGLDPAREAELLATYAGRR